MKKNKRSSKGSDSWGAALRLLTRRDYSTIELKQRLQDRGHPPDEVLTTLERCRELGYLDDQRFALNRARALLSQGRGVGVKIILDLQRRGISKDAAHKALTKAMLEFDEETLLTDLLERRFPDFDHNAATPSERRRVVHFLQRRGYPLDRIMSHLTRKGL